MKKILLLSLLLPALAVSAKTLSLFNGKDLSGWSLDTPVRDKAGPADEATIKNGVITIDTHTAEWWKSIPSFIVRDGLLVSLGQPGGHLVTEQEFSDYELVVEYRFSKTPGNCGVLVHASTPRRLYKMFPQSIEVQMMHENAGDFWCIGEMRAARAGKGRNSAATPRMPDASSTWSMARKVRWASGTP